MQYIRATLAALWLLAACATTTTETRPGPPICEVYPRLDLARIRTAELWLQRFGTACAGARNEVQIVPESVIRERCPLPGAPAGTQWHGCTLVSTRDLRAFVTLIAANQAADVQCNTAVHEHTHLLEKCTRPARLPAPGYHLGDGHDDPDIWGPMGFEIGAEASALAECLGSF